MTAPALSICVVIPARNASATLRETLDSIAAQTVSPDEIIVVDDGSTDATADIARSHYLNIRLLDGGGLGAAHAVNVGVRASNADWLAFLDSDDLWTAERIAVGLAEIRRSNPGMVLGYSVSFLDPGVSAQEAAGIRYQQGRVVGYLIGACLLRRDVFETLGGLDETLRTGSFIDFFDRFRAAGYTHTIIDSLVLNRRVRPGTLGKRSAGEKRTSLNADFLAVARSAIQRRRAARPDETSS